MILSFDILVAGAGCSGIAAAIAAARHGANVVLVNDRSVLGGNASTEIDVGISGAGHTDANRVSMNPGIFVKETGIIDELRQYAIRLNEGGGYTAAEALEAAMFDLVYAEKKLTLMLNTTVYDCCVEDSRIVSVLARNINSNDEYVINAKICIDATGHAILAERAGADYSVGREAYSEYHERWAPEKADARTMGNTILFQTEDVGHPVTFHAPAFAHNLEKLGILEKEGFTNPKCFRGLSTTGSEWTYEYGGQLDTIHDTEAIDLELRKLVYGIWDYVKNSGKYPQAANRRLSRVYTRAGTRESRRILGDYVLSENDVENKTDYPDSIGHGGWPMDIHAPEGIYDQIPASNFVPVTGPYNMPYRMLYSRNISNLMMAGRDVSATHIALGSTRVMATCSVLGQAAGTAAALCIEQGILPRDVLGTIKTLQQNIMDDDQTIYFRKDCDMSAFSAEADSEFVHEVAEQDGFFPLERDYGIAIMLDSVRLDSAEFFLKNASERPVALSYRIFTGDHPETFLPSHLLCERSVEVPACHSGWLQFPIGTEVGADRKLYVVFLQTPGISVAYGGGRRLGAITMLFHTETCCEHMNHDSVPLDLSTGYIAFDHYNYHWQTICFRNLMPEQHLFSADKAINGFSRPMGGMNLWIPSGDLPQTLTLRARVPQKARRIAIAFDNELEFDRFHEMPPALVKCFTLTVKTEKETITFQEKAAWNRYIVYDLPGDGVWEIRLTLEESYGGRPGVYAVKLLDR